MKTQKLNTRKIRAVVCIAIALISVVVAAYLLFFYNKDAYERQDIEESIADNFIADLLKIAEESKVEVEDAKLVRINIPNDEHPETTEEPSNQTTWRDEQSAYASYKRDLLSDEPEGEDYLVKQQKTYEDPNYYQ